MTDANKGCLFLLILLVTFIASLSVVLSQVFKSQHRYREAAQQCEQAGGIVIYSAWNSKVISDCVFPPKEVDW